MYATQNGQSIEDLQQLRSNLTAKMLTVAEYAGLNFRLESAANGARVIEQLRKTIKFLDKEITRISKQREEAAAQFQAAPTSTQEIPEDTVGAEEVKTP